MKTMLAEDMARRGMLLLFVAAIIGLGIAIMRFFETAASLEDEAAILVGFGLCYLCFAVGAFGSYLPWYVRVFMMVFPVLLVGLVSVSLLFG